MAFTDIPVVGRLRADVLDDMVTELRPSLARKTADETVNNSSSYQDDDELLLSVVADAVYDAYLHVVYNSGATPDFKMHLSLPSGATSPQWVYAHTGGSDAVTATSGVSGIPGDSSDAPFTMRGLILMGSTAGTAQWRWAQATANASDTIVRANSYFLLRRLS